MIYNEDRKPNFHNLELVLDKKTPPRPVLFDFIIGDEKTKMLLGDKYKNETEFDRVISNIKAFEEAGYDFSPIIIRGLEFTRNKDSFERKTKSLNSGAIIKDQQSYDSYIWPDINNCDFSMIEKAGKYLHSKAKFIPFSHDGILENTIGIVGFENLCYLMYDNPNLLEKIFNQVGLRIYQYFEKILEYDEVGAIICNDDWGFNTQTMIPPDALRRYVFPWYKKIVALAHQKNKYAILHSCGYFEGVIDDIVEDMKFDGRHSYEDKILKVEEAYDKYHERIAILGGMDVDFLSRKSPEEIYDRCRKMIQKSKKAGSYALGSGNSIPDYISNKNFLALIKVVGEGYVED